MSLKNYTVALLCFLLPQMSNSQPCINPNGENGTCVALDSCQIIKQAISGGDQEALRFYYRSMCGSARKVCCGFTANFVQPDDDGKLPSEKICGESLSDDKIIFGEISGLQEFPWTALLGFTDAKSPERVEFRCGGALINSRYVLTAAHCPKAKGSKLTRVRLGEWRISTDVDCIQTGLIERCANPVVEFGVEKIIIHEAYRSRSKTHDIALVRLDKKVTYSVSIKPICLPDMNDQSLKDGDATEVAGWGYTENGTNSDVLMKAHLSVISLNECASSFAKFFKIGDTQVCAVGKNKTKSDACQGDSGGPLMKKRNQERWYLEGTVSVGLGCGSDKFPGVYTRISKYIDWIIKNIS